MNVEHRLKALGLELPPPWTRRGEFLQFRREGSTVYLPSQICEWADS